MGDERMVERGGRRKAVVVEWIKRDHHQETSSCVSLCLLFDAGGEVEFWKDLGGLSILEAHREKSHVLSRVHRRVLRKTKTGC
ncbi:hypothetical protein EYF80_042154 [Liparis tanakae]|uniref:Uncharacterized protein n=1 Tax=Liparis tanakae TaxID=230148 RepID=A0A4Z2G4G1_9TELE|nr:hypothetical protein EYF80_042154 [Liparis tanakae]